MQLEGLQIFHNIFWCPLLYQARELEVVVHVASPRVWVLMAPADQFLSQHSGSISEGARIWGCPLYPHNGRCNRLADCSRVFNLTGVVELNQKGVASAQICSWPMWKHLVQKHMMRQTTCYANWLMALVVWMKIMPPAVNKTVATSQCPTWRGFSTSPGPSSAISWTPHGEFWGYSPGILAKPFCSILTLWFARETHAVPTSGTWLIEKAAQKASVPSRDDGVSIRSYPVREYNVQPINYKWTRFWNGTPGKGENQKDVWNHHLLFDDTTYKKLSSFRQRKCITNP